LRENWPAKILNPEQQHVTWSSCHEFLLTGEFSVFRFEILKLRGVALD
jgi:hypothetical protein